jgi:hypothetical protein
MSIIEMEAVQTLEMGVTLMPWVLIADRFKIHANYVTVISYVMENSNMMAVQIFRFNESL